MAAGLSTTGLTINLLPDVQTELSTAATNIFDDVVPAGDVVNTGTNSILGRLIGLVSPSITDLWQAIQQVYNAFDIDAATGVSLDNLCALGGVVRKSASPSIVSVLLTGSTGVSIPVLSEVGSPSTGNTFQILETVLLDATGAVGVNIDVPTVASATVYTLSFIKVPDTLSQGTFNISITSGAGATKASILTALKAAIDSGYSTLFSTAIDANGNLQVTLLDVFQKVTFSSTANLSFLKITKLSTAACTVTGPIPAALNTVTQIKTPVLNWDSVNNPASAVLGQNDETDELLRLRFKTTKGVDGTNSFEAIYSAVRAIDGVSAIALYENTADVAGYPDGMVSGPTMPAHSIYPIVLGGDTTLIAQAIWNNKAGGIKTYGSTTTAVYDSEKIPHNVSFDRPTPVDIYIALTIHEETNFPQDGTTQIKNAIIAYLAANNSIGDDVQYSRLFTPINSVVGHYVVSFTIGTTPSPVGTSNITIAYNEIATLSASNIVITTA